MQGEKAQSQIVNQRSFQSMTQTQPDKSEILSNEDNNYGYIPANNVWLPEKTVNIIFCYSNIPGRFVWLFFLMSS